MDRNSIWTLRCFSWSFDKTRLSHSFTNISSAIRVFCSGSVCAGAHAPAFAFHCFFLFFTWCTSATSICCHVLLIPASCLSMLTQMLFQTIDQANSRSPNVHRVECRARGYRFPSTHQISMKSLQRHKCARAHASFNFILVFVFKTQVQ